MEKKQTYAGIADIRMKRFISCNVAVRLLPGTVIDDCRLSNS